MSSGSRRLSAECGLGGEKMPSGSKDMSAECGLWRENAERVKKAVGGVWSRRENLFCGSRKPAVECGLGGRICFAGQEGRRRSVV